ncbi:MAG: hypothetical protein HY376_03425 [Candidatus Blackburnbacteria bacterium]|nr:hypothetical protein [Candidatus Blackburnbacteria bacterium]
MMRNNLSFFVLGVVTGVVAFRLFSEIPQKHTIFYDGSTFNPGLLVIGLGDSVTVSNNSIRVMEVAVGKHEDHKNLKGFEEKIINSGGAYSFVSEERGVFDLHDHLHPKKLGVLVVD